MIEYETLKRERISLLTKKARLMLEIEKIDQELEIKRKQMLKLKEQEYYEQQQRRIEGTKLSK